jgi:hypothetical protein
MAHPSAEKEMKSFEINLKSGNPQYYEIPDIHVPPTLSDDECFIRIIHVSDVYLLDNFARLKTLIDQSRISSRNAFLHLEVTFCPQDHLPLSIKVKEPFIA